jgi:hypothetical protein
MAAPFSRVTSVIVSESNSPPHRFRLEICTALAFALPFFVCGLLSGWIGARLVHSPPKSEPRLLADVPAKYELRPVGGAPSAFVLNRRTGRIYAVNGMTGAARFVADVSEWDSKAANAGNNAANARRRRSGATAPLAGRPNCDPAPSLTPRLPRIDFFIALTDQPMTSETVIFAGGLQRVPTHRKKEE